MKVFYHEENRDPSRSHCRSHLRGMRCEVLAYLQLHPINFGQEAGYGRMIIRRVGFDAAQMDNLRVEPCIALQGCVQRLVISNHTVFVPRQDTPPCNTPSLSPT